MNEDFEDFLRSLVAGGVRFLVVGAHALAVHGVPRATGDLDVWIACDEENAERVWRALEAFSAPAEALGITRDDLSTPDMVVQLGFPPRRIDIMTGLTGIDFDRAWDGRVLVAIGGVEVPFIGREALLENKRATGRLRDLSDVESLTNQEE